MDVVDVRITRVDYAESITASVYQRMEAERKRVANELRSTGFCRRREDPRRCRPPA
jgi:modulator of FtsH protease HflC